MWMVMGMPLAGLLYAWTRSNTPGQVIVAILLLGSVAVWTLMLTKYGELRQAEKESLRFIPAFRKEAHPVGLFLKRRPFPDCPLNVIYERTCHALTDMVEARGADPDDLFRGGGGDADFRLGKVEISSVRNVAERTMADQALLLEERMGYLATATTTAPFLGLLGTVWGVMDAFAGMAAKGSAMLSAVAPGISGALLTTVVGLVVALPSAIGYNLLGDKVRRLTVQMNNFVEELVSAIEREYLELDA